MLCYERIWDRKPWIQILKNHYWTLLPRHKCTKPIYLSLKTAAFQVVVFPLGALGFSQDRINLEVDHIGHLMGWVDRGQTNQMLWHYHMTTWWWCSVVHMSCWLKHESNLTLSSGDGDQFEHLLGLGPCVEHAHCKLGCLLHVIWVWTPLGPVTQKTHFFYEEIKQRHKNKQPRWQNKTLSFVTHTILTFVHYM